MALGREKLDGYRCYAAQENSAAHRIDPDFDSDLDPDEKIPTIPFNQRGQAAWVSSAFCEK